MESPTKKPKKIIKAVTESDDVLYALKNLDGETVEAIKSLITEAHEGEIEYKLIIIYLIIKTDYIVLITKKKI